MRIIGITGGVGCGKSLVLQSLAQKYQAAIYEADKIGHLLMKPKEVCYDKVIQLFGPSIIKADQTLDRKAIGQIVFGNPKKLEQLNAIIHPAVRQYVIETIEKERSKGTAYYVLEAALLIEEDYDAICDELWYIYTDEKIRRKRLRESRGYSEEYITEIMERQQPEEVFRRECAFTVDNSFSIEYTMEQIDKRMQEYENM